MYMYMYVYMHIYIYIYIYSRSERNAYPNPVFTLACTPCSSLRLSALHATVGWHYLSNAACLMRPRLYALFIVTKNKHDLPNHSPRLKKPCVIRVVIHKWFHLKPALATHSSQNLPTSIIPSKIA